MTQPTSDDLRWLDAAARFATPFLGTTADNPAAAALLVDPRSDALVARAVTGRGGRPHAEAQAIELAGFEAAGCTLYVTIEPCCHWGRTPPCVDAIVRAGVMRVVVGIADPNPRNAGQSVARLESAGVEVIVANHAPSALLHAGHVQRLSAGHPRVTLAIAVSEADRMVTPIGPAADWLDLLRSRSDAMLIGAATARHLDASPAIRLPGLEVRTPLRVVLSGATGVDRRLNLIGGFSGYRTAIITENSVSLDAPVSVEVLRVAGSAGRPDLADALSALSARGIQNLLVEPGPRLAAAFLEADLVDCLALITTHAEDQNGPPASPDGRIADMVDAASLVAAAPQRIGADTLTLYERSA